MLSGTRSAISVPPTPGLRRQGDIADLRRVARPRQQLRSARYLPWREFIDQYDRPGMLFYLDPPYYGIESLYGETTLRRAEFAEIADRLAALKGRFILSLNDRPETREIFARFAIESVPTNYSLQHGNKKSVTEILVSG